eukprot:9491951-Pyramimonas_sp.AAC.1
MTLPVMQAVPRSVTRPVTHAFSQSVTHSFTLQVTTHYFPPISHLEAASRQARQGVHDAQHVVRLPVPVR